MPKITISREDTEERILSLAVERGYSPTIEKRVTEKKIVEVPYFNEEGESFIQEEERDITSIISEENPETAIIFISRYYQEIIDKDIEIAFTDLYKRDLIEKRKLEDEEIEKRVKESVGNSNIIVE